MTVNNPPGVPDDVEGVTLSRSEVLAAIRIGQIEDPDNTPESTSMGDLIPDHPLIAIKTHNLPNARVHVQTQYNEDRHAVTGFSVDVEVWRFLRYRESEFNK